jgi:membrane-associated phospholipid phosphatase
LHSLKLPIIVVLLACTMTATAQVAPDSRAASDGTARAAAESSSEPPAPSAPSAESSDRGLVSDIKLYFTAPLRWDATDWAWFGGAAVLIGASHHWDSQVRTHFVRPGESTNSYSLQDALPAAGVFVATWASATLLNDNNGRREAWAMFEAAGLSSVAGYVIEYAAGREGPNNTNDPNAWRKGGLGSFPSEHTTAAFAIGTVLAESGNDDYRWARRILGYGIGIFTGYERLKLNQHWLSDTVAGAALGAASAHFTMDRVYGDSQDSNLSLEPVPGGAMLTYRVTLQ